MPQQVMDEGFNDIDLTLQPYIRQPYLSDVIQQVLGRFLGWNNAQKRWIRLRADSDGRLMVSTNPAQVSVATVTRITLAGSDELLMAANTSRKMWRIFNQGSSSVKICFDTSIGSANYFTVGAGGTYSDENYLGAVRIEGTTGDIVELIEL